MSSTGLSLSLSLCFETREPIKDIEFSPDDVGEIFTAPVNYLKLNEFHFPSSLSVSLSVGVSGQ